MTNVLPPTFQKSVRRFYLSRLVLVTSLVSICCSLAVLVLLVPAYIAVSSDSMSESKIAVEADLELGSDRRDIVRTQTLLQQLERVATSSTPIIDILREVVEARPQGVRLEEMHVVRGETGTIVVRGPAPSREGITAYRVALSKNPHFESVSVPIDILAAAEGARFTVTITGDF